MIRGYLKLNDSQAQVSNRKSERYKNLKIVIHIYALKENVQQWRMISKKNETLAGFFSMCECLMTSAARYASPQTEEVRATGEGRISLLGEWREVPPPPRLPPPQFESAVMCLFWSSLSHFPLSSSLSLSALS